MQTLWIPAIHLAHGRDVFKTLPYRPAIFKKILKSYGERALLQCRPGDAIILSDMPDEAYLGFLLERGLGTEDITVCRGDGDNLALDLLSDENAMEKISDANGKGASFYIHLEEESEIAQRAGMVRAPMHPALTRMFNTIYFLQRLEDDLGLNGMERVQVRSSRFREPAEEMLQKYGCVFVRGNESCGGSQAYIMENEDALREIEKRISANRRITRYYLSRFMNVNESWNVQYEFEKNVSYGFTGASRQTLNGRLAHAGNRGGEKPPVEVRECAEKMAARLFEMGAAGTIGMDFISCDEGVFPAEINARQNTSSPALSVYRSVKKKFPAKDIVFDVFSMEVPHNFTFTDFTKAVGESLFFDPETGCGLLPYHFGAARHTGKIDAIIFAEGKENLKDPLNALKKAL